MTPKLISRRQFLASTAIAAAGLVIRFTLPDPSRIDFAPSVAVAAPAIEPQGWAIPWSIPWSIGEDRPDQHPTATVTPTETATVAPTETPTLYPTFVYPATPAPPPADRELYFPFIGK